MLSETGSEVGHRGCRARVPNPALHLTARSSVLIDHRLCGAGGRRTRYSATKRCVEMDWHRNQELLLKDSEPLILLYPRP